MKCLLCLIRSVMKGGMQVTCDKCTPTFLSPKKLLSALKFLIALQSFYIQV